MERTNQRDIDSINLSVIPIVMVRGINGRYKIMDTYHFSKQTSDEHDINSILIALNSLKSVYDDNQIDNTLEKVKYDHRF